MGTSITIRLTPSRECLLKLLKKRYKLKKTSEAIDFALRMSFKEDIDYRSRIERVAGCVSLEGRKTSVQRIRSFRSGV